MCMTNNFSGMLRHGSTLWQLWFINHLQFWFCMVPSSPKKTRQCFLDSRFQHQIKKNHVRFVGKIKLDLQSAFIYLFPFRNENDFSIETLFYCASSKRSYLFHMSIYIFFLLFFHIPSCKISWNSIKMVLLKISWKIGFFFVICSWCSWWLFPAH